MSAYYYYRIIGMTSNQFENYWYQIREVLIKISQDLRLGSENSGRIKIDLIDKKSSLI